MLELIAIIILGSSLIGMGVIIFRKIPVLLTLPEISIQKESFVLKLKKRLKKLNPFRNFSYEIFLQKILTKIRIISLKTDNEISHWLQKLRERVQKKKREKSDNYWEEVKKEIKKK